jgi:hypothetical protein
MQAPWKRKSPLSRPNPSESLMMLATGYWIPRCLHVVAELGVADQLGDGLETPAALAKAVGAHPDALARVLRALASVGVFEEVDGRFRHSAASRLLRSDHPQSQRSFVRMMGMPVHWAAYGQLEHAVRSGESAMQQVSPGGTFEYFATHPQESRLFDEAMTAKSLQPIPAIVRAYDFSGFGLIADVGGGRGHLLQGVLAATPAAKGVLCDLPHVISNLGGLRSERLALHALDFFKDALPACDAYLMMSVLHDWGDVEAIAILQAVRRSAPAHTKLLVFELTIPEAPGPHPGKMLDIEMLVMTRGGRERSRAEFARLYEAAGFRLEKVIATSAGTMILQGAVG